MEKSLILADGKLDKYIEELTRRYPDKYVEIIRKDLKSEKDFTGAIQELMDRRYGWLYKKIGIVENSVT